MRWRGSNGTRRRARSGRYAARHRRTSLALVGALTLAGLAGCRGPAAPPRLPGTSSSDVGTATTPAPPGATTTGANATGAATSPAATAPTGVATGPGAVGAAEAVPWQPAQVAGAAAYRVVVAARTEPRVLAAPLAPPPAGGAVLLDQAIVRVVGPDGAFLAAATPVPPDATRLVVAAGGQPAVVVAAGPALTLTIRVTDRLVATAAWRTRDGVRSLAVTPTWAARGWLGGGDAVWSAVRALRPDADTPGMGDQLRCHVQFAPTKATWFLEPDRPALGYAATVAAGCNPGNLRDGG